MAERIKFEVGHLFDPYFCLHENWLAFDKEEAVEDTLARAALYDKDFMTEDDLTKAVVPSIMLTTRGRIGRGDFPLLRFLHYSALVQFE